MGRGLRGKLFSFLLAFVFSISSLQGFAGGPVDFDAYFAGLKVAIDKGDLNTYLSLQPGNTSQVKKIVFNPEKLDGDLHTLFLIFDTNQNLTHFSLDDQSPISLVEEQRALFAVYKDNKELLQNFFYNPTPQLRHAMEDLVEPIATAVAGKIAENMRTRQGEWISNASADSLSLAKKAFNVAKLQAYVGGNLTFRALNAVNCVLLGGWIVISALALPMLPALGIIPLAWVPEAFPALAVGTISALATRKTISFILGKMIKFTDEQIKILKGSETTEPAPLRCKSGMGKLLKFIFR
jgi:hypothetical protein